MELFFLTCFMPCFIAHADEIVPDEKSAIDANDVVVGVTHQESFEVGSMKRKYAEKSRLAVS